MSVCDEKNVEHFHSPSFADGPLGAELVFLNLGDNGELAIGDRNTGATVIELGGNVFIVIERVLGLDVDVMGTASSGRVNRENTFELGVRSVVSGGSVGGRHDNQRNNEKRALEKLMKDEVCSGVLGASMRIVGGAKLVRVHARVASDSRK